MMKYPRVIFLGIWISRQSLQLYEYEKPEGFFQCFQSSTP